MAKLGQGRAFYQVPNNQSNTRIHVGAVRLSKTNTMYFFRNQAEGKYKQVKFCLGPEGRGKLGTYFLVFKDPETNMLTYILVLFGSTRLSEVTHIFDSVVKAEGNVSDINVHYMRLRETNPNNFLGTKTHVKICLGLQG